MAQGDRPDLTIALKPRGGTKEDRIYLFSGWSNDGRISSASLDRRVVEFAVKLEDGSIVRVKRGRDGKLDHYVDVFLRDGHYGDERREGGGNGNGRRPPPRDDDAGGEIPF